MTNRVGTERRGSEGETNNTTPDSTRFSSPRDPAACPRDRPPSSASSVASSTRNPFAPDDFDDSRSTHSESENVYSCPPASAFLSQQPAAGHMPRICSKHPAAAAPFHAMLNHRFDQFAFPGTPFFSANMSPAFDPQFQRSAPSSQMMCHHMGQVHQMQSECDCRYYYRPDPRVTDMYQHPDLRYQYFQRMQQMYQQHQQQKSTPTEFGSSFEFDTDFESSARGLDVRQISQFAYPSHGHHERDPFAPAPDSRCLSPNNPFNPIFGPNERMMSAVLESQYGMAPPPRPPARIPDMRRASFGSDASPPPLPKRKMPQPTQPQHHNYHNAPRELENRNVYACPPGDLNQSHGPVAADSPPPLPLPSRKKSTSSRPQFERRVSFDTPPKPVDDPNDPFNVSYIEKHLNQVSIGSQNTSRVMSSLEKSKRIQTSTPLASESGTDIKKAGGLHLSSIKSVSDADRASISAGGLNDSSVFESSSLSSGFDSGGYKRLQDEQTQTSIQSSQLQESQRKEELEAKDGGKKGPFHHFGEDHISPEERNIFRAKDPFADDDFFAP